mgnify:CR=1 FL=1
MPLKCLHNGEEIFAFNITDDAEWKQLKILNAAQKCLKMCCCSSTVVLRTSHLGTKHFAHSRRGECTTAPESVEHLLAKTTIVSGIRRTPWIAKVEQNGKTPSGDEWVADVMASLPGKKSAVFEVQWSRQTEHETRERQARYEVAGIRSMWFFRQHDFPVEKEVPAFRLCFNEKSKTFHVLIPSPFYSGHWIRHEDKDEPRYWQQSVELSRFVEGSLMGRLHFAPALNKRMPLEVFAASTTCWRCHRKTRIITSLVFTANKVLPGCPDINTSIYSFEELISDGASILMAMLPVDILKQHGIGKVKPRYSKTVGSTYLSNGCVHCDALQGRHFDHDVAYDEEMAFSVEVFFDETWASQLHVSRNDIYRWWFDDSF